MKLLLFLFFPLLAHAENWCEIPFKVYHSESEHTVWYEAGIPPTPGKGTYLYMTSGWYPHISGIYGPVFEMASHDVQPVSSRGAIYLMSGKVPTGRIGLNVTHSEGQVVVQSSGVTRLQYWPYQGRMKFINQNAELEGNLHIVDGELIWESYTGTTTVIAGR